MLRYIKLFENFLSEGVDTSKVIDYYKKNSYVWHMSGRDDFYSMASGGGDPEIRERYPNWTDEDFKGVIIALDGEYEEPEFEEDESFGEESQPSPRPRPTEKEINRVITKYKNDPDKWYMAGEDDFKYAARGIPDPDLKYYYPGWEKEDFQKVIDAVGPSQRKKPWED